MYQKGLELGESRGREPFLRLLGLRRERRGARGMGEGGKEGKGELEAHEVGRPRRADELGDVFWS